MVSDTLKTLVLSQSESLKSINLSMPNLEHLELSCNTGITNVTLDVPSLNYLSIIRIPKTSQFVTLTDIRKLKTLHHSNSINEQNFEFLKNLKEWNPSIKIIEVFNILLINF